MQLMYAPLCNVCVCARVCCLLLGLQVWQYPSAMAHLNVCLEIAAGAVAEKKRYSLAIIYDEICCKEWHLKATRGEPRFTRGVDHNACA